MYQVRPFKSWRKAKRLYFRKILVFAERWLYRNNHKDDYAQKILNSFRIAVHFLIPAKSRYPAKFEPYQIRNTKNGPFAFSFQRSFSKPFEMIPERCILFLPGSWPLTRFRRSWRPSSDKRWFRRALGCRILMTLF